MAFSLATTALAASMHPGWAFDARGGHPPLPTGWPAYSGVLRDSSVVYFAGNASGADSPSEIAAEARYGIAGLGWQLSNVPSNNSNLEHFEAATATALKAARPGVKVMVTRDTQVIGIFWNSTRAALAAHPEYFLLDPKTGKPIVEPWGSPTKNTPKSWLNFTNPAATAWWEEVFIGEALAQYDGVYTDCACEDPPGIDAATLAAVRAAAQASVDRVAQRAAAAGKWMSSWASPGATLACKWGVECDVITPANCAAQVRGLLARTAASYAAPQLQYDFRDTSQRLDVTAAAFLLVRALSATLMWPVTGTYESVADFPWDDALMTRDFGRALNATGEVADGVFVRRYERGVVRLDCGAFEASFG